MINCNSESFVNCAKCLHVVLKRTSFQWLQYPLTLLYFRTQNPNYNRANFDKKSEPSRDLVDVRRTWIRHARCPPTVSQSIWYLSLLLLLWRAEAGSDEDAGTWPSGSILRRLLPRSIFADIKSQLPRWLLKNEDSCVEQESLGRGGRINRSTHIGSDA